MVGIELILKKEGSNLPLTQFHLSDEKNLLNELFKRINALPEIQSISRYDIYYEDNEGKKHPIGSDEDILRFNNQSHGELKLYIEDARKSKLFEGLENQMYAGAGKTYRQYGDNEEKNDMYQPVTFRHMNSNSGVATAKHVDQSGMNENSSKYPPSSTSYPAYPPTTSTAYPAYPPTTSSSSSSYPTKAYPPVTSIPSASTTYPPNPPTSTYPSYPPTSTYPSYPPTSTYPSYPPTSSYPSHPPTSTYPSYPPTSTYPSYPPTSSTPQKPTEPKYPTTTQIPPHSTSVPPTITAPSVSGDATGTLPPIMTPNVGGSFFDTDVISGGVADNVLPDYVSSPLLPVCDYTHTIDPCFPPPHYVSYPTECFPPSTLWPSKPAYDVNDSCVTTEVFDPCINPYVPILVCNSCNLPIRGIRYRCLDCMDYDLCSLCDAKGIHSHHPMVRLLCNYPSTFPSVHGTNVSQYSSSYYQYKSSYVV